MSAGLRTSFLPHSRPLPRSGKWVEPLESRALLSVTPSGFTQNQYVGGLEAPTAMDFAPDGRLFVCQQTGGLRVVKNGTLLAAPFVNLPVDHNGERGLLGVAFDPSFATNHYVYVYWTTDSPAAHNRVSRFTADPSNPDVALAGSELDLIDLPDLSAATNHNGGAIHFGPDGKLYIGVGDNANGANAQSLNTTKGKVLRINSDGTIPADNPFVSQTTGINQAIWAMGFRNPFTFAVEPTSVTSGAQTTGGRIFVNDVGLNTWEEIDQGIAGANYGWPITEGDRTAGQVVPANYRDPLFTYNHGKNDSNGCAITGGTFYEPPAGATAAFPAPYVGRYFYDDLCGGYIRSIDPANPAAAATTFATHLGQPVDLKVGPDGRLFALNHSGSVQVFAPTASGSGGTPDLAVTVSGRVPARAISAGAGYAGDRISVKIHIINAGNSQLTGTVPLHLYFSTDTALDGSDTLVPGVAISARLNLRPNHALTRTVTFRVPALPAGTYYVIGQSESGNTGELDVSDNAASLSTPIAVTPATIDLTGAFHLPTPTALTPGGASTLRLDVTNAGTVAASGRLTVEFDAVAAATPTAAGTPLATVTHAAKVRPGHSAPTKVRFRVPADLAAGEYLLVARIDPMAIFSDVNITNNRVTAGQGITVA